MIDTTALLIASMETKHVVLGVLCIVGEAGIRYLRTK